MDKLNLQIWDKNQFLLVLCQFARQVDYGVMIVDPQKEDEIVYTNNVLLAMTGYRADEIVQAKLSILHGSLTSEESITSLNLSMKHNMSYKMAMFSYRKNETAFWNELSSLPIRDTNGDVIYYYVVCRNITNVVNTESLVTLEREVYAAIEEGTTIDIIIGKICEDIALTLMKTCHCSIVLEKQNRFEMTSFGEIPEALQINREQLEQTVLEKTTRLIERMREGMYATYDYTFVRHQPQSNDFQAYWMCPIMGAEQQLLGTFHLAFEKNVELNESDQYYLQRLTPIILLAFKYTEQKNEIRQLAYYDHRTALPNMALFEKQVVAQQLIGSIFIFEPGEFQHIIDVYGRKSGDVLLKQLAERIQALSIFEQAIIARYTSSSIIVALPSIELDTAMLKTYLNELTLNAYYIEQKHVHITLKIGTAPLMDNDELNVAVQQADIALSAALKGVGTIIENYIPSLIESMEEKMNVLSHLTEALQHNEFFPVLQPKVNIITGEIVSFEALARWISPSLGFVSPAVFIPIAEGSGNIHRVDQQIFMKVLQWLAARQEKGLPLYQVSVNISPPHFYSPTFVEDTIALIQSYRIDYQYIKIEITESIELENVLRAKTIIKELQSYGIETAVDDFGVGYSSLSYLQELPFDEVKIDKSFIDNLSNPRMYAIIKTLVQLAKDLQMEVVAEGIETEEQHNMLAHNWLYAWTRLLLLQANVVRRYFVFNGATGRSTIMRIKEALCCE